MSGTFSNSQSVMESRDVTDTTLSTTRVLKLGGGGGGKFTGKGGEPLFHGFPKRD